MITKQDREATMHETGKHRANVTMALLKLADELNARAYRHDNSKDQQPELDVFVEFTPKLRDCTYGSEEYKGFLASMGVALAHHYEANSHHPEHFENGIDGMNLLDLVEMFCDWKAATMRHADGDLKKSIEINKDRFKMSDQLAQIFRNSVSLVE
jgi:Family of unknown function (DUF5662)